MTVKITCAKCKYLQAFDRINCMHGENHSDALLTNLACWHSRLGQPHSNGRSDSALRSEMGAWGKMCLYKQLQALLLDDKIKASLKPLNETC